MSKPLKKIALAVLVLVACDLFAYVWYGNSVKGQFEGINPGRADCAIVFFHDFTEDWRLNEETIRRCRHALNLFLRHRVSVPICSGGNRPREGKSGAKLMLEWLVEQGVPGNALHTEINSCETLGNIRNSLRIAKTLGYSSALFVSSPLHLYRMKLLLPKKAPRAITALFAPYLYEGILPELGPLSLFTQTHYEWVSLGLYLCLPRSLYNQIIYHKRGCRPGTDALY
jgi:hypothetical protein